MSDSQSQPEVERTVAGSGIFAARCLVEGRRVRSKLSGYLGVILNKEDVENEHDRGSQDPPIHRPFKVRLHDGRIFWYAPEQIEPWTRGVFVTSRFSGKSGEIRRVDQSVPPAKRPYLVHLEDGQEFWYSLDEVSFLSLKRRGTSRLREAARHEVERCALTMVPGKWRLRLHGSSDDSSLIELRGTPEGKLVGTGEDFLGSFSFAGAEQQGALDISIEYIDRSGASADVSLLAGAWEIKSFGVAAKWAAIESKGHAYIAGAEAGRFRVEGARFNFTDRNSGTSHKVIPYSADMLCWDDGRVWQRLRFEQGDAGIGHICKEAVRFDPPKRSEQESDGLCEISQLEFVSSNIVSVSFEMTCQGSPPCALKTELRIDDGRVVETTRGEYSACVAKGKQRKSSIKGTLIFEDVTLLVGSALSFRFGGEYDGYCWADLVSAPDALLGLSASLYYPQNPLRTRYLRGHVAGGGLSADGLVDEGLPVVVTGKTASSIKVARSGRMTTLSLRPYFNRDEAKISVRGPAVIRFPFFKTEATYDFMEIAGIEYSGDDLPPPHFVPEGLRLVMSWSSDETTTDDGWEITVESGLSHVQLSSREAEFGARGAPWNQAEASSYFAAQIVHVASNALGLAAFASQDVAGRVVLMSAAVEAGDAESYAAVLTDAELFTGPLLARVRNAERAGARAVMFIAERREPPGPLALWKMIDGYIPHGDDVLIEAMTVEKAKLKCAELPDCQGFCHAGAPTNKVVTIHFKSKSNVTCGAQQWTTFLKRTEKAANDNASTTDSLPPTIPAVIVGKEFGDEIVDALGQENSVTAGPRNRRFSLELVEPCELDGSRDLALLAVGSDNVLRAILSASRQSPDVEEHVSKCGDAAAGPKHCEIWRRNLSKYLASNTEELRSVALKVCKRMAPYQSVTRALESSLQKAEMQDSETQPSEEQVDYFLREMLRELMPMVLPSKALLPGLDVERRGTVWDHHLKGQCLGEGSFGVVHQAWDRYTASKVAVKKVRLKEDDDGDCDASKKDLLIEFELMRDMSHPNLMRVLDLYACDKKLYFVADYAARGDLTGFITSPEKVDERWIAGVVRQVLAACAFLHRRCIVHHDVKPANVLMTDVPLQRTQVAVSVVLLADFGLSQTEHFVANESRKTAGAGNGTPCYMPPESAKGFSGPKTDAYAIGIMLYELLSGGFAPDPIIDDGEVADVDWTLLGRCTADASNTTKDLIAPSVGDRLSCQDALQLDWFWRIVQTSACDSADDAAGVVQRFVDANRLVEPEIVDEMVERLCKIVHRSCFYRLAMNLFVGQMPLKDLRTTILVFEALDIDRDGVLSVSELEAALPSDGIQDTTAQQVLFAVDVHGRGFLEFREFAAACVNLSELSEEVVHGIVEKLFAQIGGLHGGIDFAAITQRCSFQNDADVENLAELFHAQDANGDGHLTRDEFFRLYGIAANPTWSQPKLEDDTPAMVRVLRGSREEAWTQGTKVVARSFATFGAPTLGRTTGRWYYEVRISKYESPQIGWVDEEFEMIEAACDDGVGDDSHGWGVDGERNCKWHDGHQSYTGIVLHWPRPLVLGCALELGAPDKGQMRFSLDGKWDVAPAFEEIAPHGQVYPAASGILGGVFYFSAEDCVFSPPDSSYGYLL